MVRIQLPTFWNSRISPVTVFFLFTDWFCFTFPEFALVADEVEYLLSAQSETTQLTDITLNTWPLLSTQAQIVSRVYDIWGGVATTAVEITLLPAAQTSLSLDLLYKYANVSDETKFDQTVAGIAAYLAAVRNTLLPLDLVYETWVFILIYL